MTKNKLNDKHKLADRFAGLMWVMMHRSRPLVPPVDFSLGLCNPSISRPQVNYAPPPTPDNPQREGTFQRIPGEIQPCSE